MSSVNKILLWIRICNFISYAVMYSFVEFESLKKWLVLPLLTCRFLTFANTVFANDVLFFQNNYVPMPILDLNKMVDCHC